MILGKFYNIPAKNGSSFYLHALQAILWSDSGDARRGLRAINRSRIVYNALPYDKHGDIDTKIEDKNYFNYAEMFERCTVVHRHECV